MEQYRSGWELACHHLFINFNIPKEKIKTQEIREIYEDARICMVVHLEAVIFLAWAIYKRRSKSEEQEGEGLRTSRQTAEITALDSIIFSDRRPERGV